MIRCVSWHILLDWLRFDAQPECHGLMTVLVSISGLASARGHSDKLGAAVRCSKTAALGHQFALDLDAQAHGQAIANHRSLVPILTSDEGETNALGGSGGSRPPSPRRSDHSARREAPRRSCFWQSRASIEKVIAKFLTFRRGGRLGCCDALAPDLGRRHLGPAAHCLMRLHARCGLRFRDRFRPRGIRTDRRSRGVLDHHEARQGAIARAAVVADNLASSPVSRHILTPARAEQSGRRRGRGHSGSTAGMDALRVTGSLRGDTTHTCIIDVTRNAVGGLAPVADRPNHQRLAPRTMSPAAKTPGIDVCVAW